AVGDVGEDDAGEDGVRERIADEGEPAEDDEAANKPAEGADDDHLHHRALHEAVFEGFGDPGHGAASKTATWPPKVARMFAGVKVVSVGPNATMRRFMQSTWEVVACTSSRSWVATMTAIPDSASPRMVSWKIARFV